MSVMWHGPNSTVISARQDSLFQRIARRLAKQNRFFSLSHNGKSAEVYAIRGEYKLPLAPVTGDNPYHVALRIAARETPKDRELCEQILEYQLDRLIGAIR